MMTTATTIAGLWPLAIVTGRENEIWPPFATIVIGGLLTSSVLTLLMIPVGFILLRKLEIDDVVTLLRYGPGRRDKRADPDRESQSDRDQLQSKSRCLRASLASAHVYYIPGLRNFSVIRSIS